MIREYSKKDRGRLDEMQFSLQKYFSEVDKTGESLKYENIAAAHQYMQKMLDDSRDMNGKVFVAEINGKVAGFIQGVIIEHKKGDDKIYDLSHRPSKEGWIGLLFVEPENRSEGIGQQLLDKMCKYFEEENCSSIRLLVLFYNLNAINFYRKNGFINHNLEMVRKV